MTALIREPIIIVSDDGLLVFETLSHATTYIEPRDTEDCTSAFDSEGRLLRVLETNALEEQEPDALPKTSPWLPGIVRRFIQRWMERELADIRRTEIEPLEQEPTHQSELREILTHWLVTTTSLNEHKRKGILPVSREQLAQESLEQLVSRALKYSVR